MKIEEDFEQIGALNPGELIIKFPGTDLKMLYEHGSAFLNKNGVGYVSIAIRDAYCQECGEARGISGALGKQIAEKINDPKIKPLLKKMLAQTDHSLFYSRTKKGIEIICLPGLSGKNEVSELDGLILASYGMKGQIPSAESVYAYHRSVIDKKELITDKERLEREVLQLVPKANDVYEKCLQIIKESGF